jgi:hypothetical protein
MRWLADGNGPSRRRSNNLCGPARHGRDSRLALFQFATLSSAYALRHSPRARVAFWQAASTLLSNIGSTSFQTGKCITWAYACTQHTCPLCMCSIEPANAALKSSTPWQARRINSSSGLTIRKDQCAGGTRVALVKRVRLVLAAQIVRDRTDVTIRSAGSVRQPSAQNRRSQLQQQQRSASSNHPCTSRPTRTTSRARTDRNATGPPTQSTHGDSQPNPRVSAGKPPRCQATSLEPTNENARGHGCCHPPPRAPAKSACSSKQQRPVTDYSASSYRRMPSLTINS